MEAAKGERLRDQAEMSARLAKAESRVERTDQKLMQLGASFFSLFFFYKIWICFGSKGDVRQGWWEASLIAEGVRQALYGFPTREPTVGVPLRYCTLSRLRLCRDANSERERPRHLKISWAADARQKFTTVARAAQGDLADQREVTRKKQAMMEENANAKIESTRRYSLATFGFRGMF